MIRLTNVRKIMEDIDAELGKFREIAADISIDKSRDTT